MSHSQQIPPFSIRESSRAKRVILKILPGRGLEVVTPRGFRHTEIPRIIRENQAWIQRTLRKLSDQGIVHRPTAWELPQSIYLRAIDRHFAVRYVSRNTHMLHLISGPGTRLELIGDLTDRKGCQQLLRAWLKQCGQVTLLPWLEGLSVETGLTFTKAQIRCQKSRWGSCSRKGTISLNSKLLFLSPELVRYIMIHELCHRLHLNHSKEFWAAVAEREPNYKSLDTAMNSVRKEIPLWVG
jgi:predicted metal-dependent hydrolase